MHITKYGNKYTDEEWREAQAEFKKQAKIDNEIADKIKGMEKYLYRMLTEEGLTDKQTRTVARLFKYGEYEEANIQWTSDDRKEIIDDLYARWDAAMSKIYNGQFI